MRFAPTAEQRQFAASLHDLLAGADTPATVRAWGDGRHEPGLKIWRDLADLGLPALLVPERDGGLGGSATDLVVAFEVLGYHAVPGPLAESVAVAPSLAPRESLPALASGELLATVAQPPLVPYALDADVAGLVLRVHDGAVERTGADGEPVRSLDAARRLFPVRAGEVLGTAPAEAFELGVLAVSAQLTGAGRWLLGQASAYAKQREQYGRAIGSFQAVKHLLADVATRLELARPLAHGAAVTMTARDVSAAKVAAGEAAYLAARTALQVHGAIGYTAEHDLGLWLTRVRALTGAWGGAAWHRARVLGGRDG
ncbi:acyl-CoA dehydrogenase family protein [Prauserella flavalba]|uniref:Acyl-CoA dehydrogenase n=1 Tax=Prauserella flavalba TaxID=1477506 RepID=A0A318LKV5_9PSEU|nr:acyl-CoA dehydrogenase family protein [Prauserella flavalba]PXY34008.1 acyl-CoA dehydrogenase [Prauserella flavalba]